MFQRGFVRYTNPPSLAAISEYEPLFLLFFFSFYMENGVMSLRETFFPKVVSGTSIW